MLRKTDKKLVISVDFDETLAKTETCWNGWIHLGTGQIIPVPEIIEFVKGKYEEGFEIHIVTFRSPEHRDEVLQFIEDHSLPITEIHCTGGNDKTPKLLEINSEFHVDDSVETLVLAQLKGIKGLLVDNGQHSKNSTAELFDKIVIK